ncbi:MAG: hypothetical protein PHD67_02135 [Oscillospiraceae bacterium]|nr:hypothetical protein [Oscillospiraceae bacterium]
MKIAMTIYLILLAAGKLLGGVLELCSDTMVPLWMILTAMGIGVAAAAMAVRMMLRRATSRGIAGFFAAQLILTLFTIFYIALAVPVDITLLDITVTGTFFEVLVTTAFLLMQLRYRRYIRIQTAREEQERQVVAATSHRDEDILPVDVAERARGAAEGQTERPRYVSVKREKPDRAENAKK